MQVQRAVWPLPVVVTHVDAKDVAEVAAADDQDPVEQLAAGAAHPALHVRVRVRRLDWSADDSDVVPAKTASKAAANFVSRSWISARPRSSRSISRLRACCSIHACPRGRSGSRGSKRFVVRSSDGSNHRPPLNERGGRSRRPWPCLRRDHRKLQFAHIYVLARARIQQKRRNRWLTTGAATAGDAVPGRKWIVLPPRRRGGPSRRA